MPQVLLVLTYLLDEILRQAIKSAPLCGQRAKPNGWRKHCHNTRTCSRSHSSMILRILEYSTIVWKELMVYSTSQVYVIDVVHSALFADMIIIFNSLPIIALPMYRRVSFNLLSKEQNLVQKQQRKSLRWSESSSRLPLPPYSMFLAVLGPGGFTLTTVIQSLTKKPGHRML